MKNKKNRRLIQKARLNPLPDGYRWVRQHQVMAVSDRRGIIVLWLRLNGADMGHVYRAGTGDLVADFGTDLEAAFTFMSNKLLFGDT